MCDIDMLVLYYTNTPYSLPAQPDDYRTVHLASLCLVIEVKEHPPEQVRFVGTQTEVQVPLPNATTTGQVPAYVTNLGTQLLIIQGRGGTGKTATLLRLAHLLYAHRQARVLLLTYNRAPVADIRRLLALLGVRDGIAQQSIAVQTVHSYFYQLLRGFGIVNPQHNDFLANYDTYKQTLQQRLAMRQQPGQIESLIQKNNAAFSWDFIFIDEAQDWPTDERDI